MTEQEAIEQPSEHTNSVDTGLVCLSLLLNLKGFSVNPDDIRKDQRSAGKINLSDIMGLSRDQYHLKARIREFNKKEQYLDCPLPAIVETNEKEYILILRRKDDNNFIIQDPIHSEFGPQTVDIDALLAISSGHVALFKHRHNTEDEKLTAWWFVEEALQQKGIFTNVIIFSILIQVFAVITPLFSMIIIDKVFSNSGTSTLNVLIIAMMMIAIFDFVVGGFRRYLVNFATNKIDVTLVSRLFRKLTQLPANFHTLRATGDTVSRIKDIEVIRSFITGSALMALIDIPFTVIFLFVMFIFSKILMVVVLVAVILLLLLYGVAAPFMKKNLQKKYQIQADNQSFLVEVVGGIETVKSLSVEPYMQGHWENQVAEQSRYSQEAERLNDNITQIAQFINKATIAICLWVGANAVLAGNMTAGQLIAFNMMVGRVTGPAQRIAQMSQKLSQVNISIKRVADLYNAQSEPSYGKSRVNLPDLKGQVAFQNVSYRYTDDTPNVLENISFNVQQGQIIGIIGSSGSGKSTLVKLIMRLAVPTSGRILVDDINIANIDPTWFRRKIGVVMQDNLLFNRTIYENITMVNSSLTMQNVERACKLAGADEFIRNLPNAYDTIVGERGQMLSTGQRQRIALARALVNDPKILILDEATSSLDSESEHIIQQNMRAISKGRTVFIVAHRLSTLRIVDRIMTLENGHLIEDGTPKQLLQTKGRFAQLLSLELNAKQNANKQHVQAGV